MMETSRSVSAIHIRVMEDVAAKVRNEFAASGVDEEVLSVLQAIWEHKMLLCGGIAGMVRRPVPPPAAAVHYLNVPNEGPYETPTVEMLFPPTPHYNSRQTPHYTPGQTQLPGTVQTPPLRTVQIPLPGNVDQSMHYNNIPTGPSQVSNSRNDVETICGRTGPYMQPTSPWMNRRPLGVNVNAGNEAARGIPQHMTQTSYYTTRQTRVVRTPLPENVDQSMHYNNIPTGPSQQPPSPWMNRRPLGVNVNAGNEAARGIRQHTTQDFFMGSSEKCKQNEYSSQLTSGGHIPQRDGSGDMMIEFPLPEANTNANAIESLLTRVSLGSDISATVFTKEQRSNTLLAQQDGVNEEYDHFYHCEGVSSEGHHAPAHYVKNETLYDDEPPLNEDDDEEDDLEDEQGNAEPNTHLVLAQFDKVTRKKSKWKCTLKSGIMHYNNRDVLFNTATGEFEFW